MYNGGRVLENGIITYEGGNLDMSGKKKKNKQDMKNQTSTDGSEAKDSEEEPQIEVRLKEKCINLIAKIPYIKVIATGMALLSVVFSAGVGLTKLSEFMNTMQTNMEELNADMKGVKNELESFQIERAEDKLEIMEKADDLIEKKFAKIEEDMNELDDQISHIRTVSFKDNFLPCLAVQKNSYGLYETAAPSWEREQIIAVDPVTNELFSAVELVNQRILVPYEMNGEQILFCGQYNKKNHWDGKCIINVYKNGILTVLTEAVYNNGELMKYKQVIPDVNKSGKEVWIVSDRVHSENFNSGDSWSYKRQGGYIQKFDLKDAAPEDILNITQFKKEKCNVLEGFYHGNTSDGKYNDGTGKAYMVKYDSWGYVRTLYVGRVKDGDFEDDTGEAWYIVRDEEKNTDYMYYKGAFHNGKPISSDPDDFINPYSFRDIDDTIKSYQFECTLKWYNPRRQNM